MVSDPRRLLKNHNSSIEIDHSFDKSSVNGSMLEGKSSSKRKLESNAPYGVNKNLTMTKQKRD